MRLKKKIVGNRTDFTKLPFLENGVVTRICRRTLVACVGFVSVTGFIGSNFRNGYSKSKLGFVFLFLIFWIIFIGLSWLHRHGRNVGASTEFWAELG